MAGKGQRRTYMKVTDFKAGKILALESTNGFLRQRFEVRTKRYHDRTVVHITLTFRRTSALFHYTIGAILSYLAEIHLEEWTPIVIKMYRNLEEEHKDLNF
ncbi:uncharacterized protein LOC105702698 [Orussus abietinus]|uniref:uncharacterized protein LOC105702698 n=1 Tax=Orussus abietinus TaxID=222816 RepID=UPI0006260F1F|nr:uncharacterized protein LOC105702698 [Orussus abietinus]